MASPFAAAMRAADRIIDKVFAEPVRVEPQASGEYVATDDTSRDPYVADMIVGMYPNNIQFKYVGKYDGDKPQIAGDEVHIWALDEKLPADRSQWPKINDRLVLVDRPDEHALLIHTIERDDVGRFMYRCVWTPRP